MGKVREGKCLRGNKRWMGGEGGVKWGGISSNRNLVWDGLNEEGKGGVYQK